MIEISHAQAKRLIRAQIDELKLPEEQWAVLQAHLENCEACRSYRRDLQRQERELRRDLRGRWQAVDGPDPATPEIVLAARGAVEAWRGAFRKAGAGVLVLFLLAAAWMGWQSSTREERQRMEAAAALASLTPTPTQTPTPTPTPVSSYRGQILYQQPDASGQSDIFLLNSGVEPTNMTDHPAQDMYPAWSPDGEWVAFLSNRAGNDDSISEDKYEVWVMHISGASLTQLTNEPGVEWRGPLSWSPDGEMLALIGWRSLTGAEADGDPGAEMRSWVYLVPVDGSGGPIVMGYSQGADRAAFSPGKARRLAFSGAQAWNYGPVVYHLDENVFTALEETAFSDREHRVSALEWSLSGEQILFQVEGPFVDGLPKPYTNTFLRASRMTVGSRGEPATTTARVTQNLPLGSVTSPGWTGIKDEFAFLYLEDGCPRLVLGTITRSANVPVNMLSTLCIQSLSPVSNWRTANKSVIVSARRPGESVPGLYVLRFTERGVTTERMIDLDPAASMVQLRPQGYPVLAIDPAPGRNAPIPPPASPPGADYAEFLFTTESGDRTFIEAMRPDGTGRRLVNQSVGYNGCPVWSPDRKQIAFLSDREKPGFALNTFIMDASGRDARAMSFWRNPQNNTCPLWSPDGQWVVFTSGTNAVVERVKPSTTLSNLYGFSITFDPLTPMWLPDGRMLVFESHGPLSITARAGSPEQLPYQYTIMRSSHEFDEWPDIFTLVNTQLAPGLLDISATGDSMIFAGMTWDESVEEASLYMTNFERGGYTVLGSLFAGKEYAPLPLSLRRLSGGEVALVYRGYADSRYKTAVYLLDLSSGEMRWLARLQDALIQAEWSKDGEYVLLNTESGMWALDIAKAKSGEAGPVWVGDIGTATFSWEE